MTRLCVGACVMCVCVCARARACWLHMLYKYCNISGVRQRCDIQGGNQGRADYLRSHGMIHDLSVTCDMTLVSYRTHCAPPELCCPENCSSPAAAMALQHRACNSTNCAGTVTRDGVGELGFIGLVPVLGYHVSERNGNISFFTVFCTTLNAQSDAGGISWSYFSCKWSSDVSHGRETCRAWKGTPDGW